MIFPGLINKGDLIGVTACSAGKNDELDIIRMDHAAMKFSSVGYTVIETDNCRKCSKGRSSDAKIRIKEFQELLCDSRVTCIIMCSGGDYLIEIIELLDFELIRKKNKWIQGYSDPTGLLYTITTNTELATIYGSNFGDFGMEEWHSSLHDNISFLEGNWDTKKGFIQKNYPKYQDGFIEKKTGIEKYDMSVDVSWKNVSQPSTINPPEQTGGIKITAEGRMLGGCLDVLINLVGTKYDKTIEYIKKYENDGILWYLESFDLNSERLYLGLWNLKKAGWFNTARAFIFGRPAFFSSGYDISYEETVKGILKDMGVPIILDACFGHKPPRMTIINGAYGVLTSKNGRGSLVQKLV